MTNRIKMTIEMEVTPSQGLALQAMFEYWNKLASWGSSREVGFYVDGDGNFKPKCKVTFDGTIPNLTDEIRQFAIIRDTNGNRMYDFDSVAWIVRK